ncbi:hypothetical protein OCUBac02_23140 [Bosea sp. ANAM02]|nr:hypothetical protein OCUBac02_23140 [Bosea sp. ANAM02]
MVAVQARLAMLADLLLPFSDAPPDLAAPPVTRARRQRAKQGGTELAKRAPKAGSGRRRWK